MTAKQMIMVGLGAAAIAAAPALLIQYGSDSTKMMALNVMDPMVQFGSKLGIVKKADADKGDLTSYYMFCAVIGGVAVILMYLYLKFVKKSI